MNMRLNRFQPIGCGVPVGLLGLACPQLAMAHAAEDGLILLLPTDVYITAGVTVFVLTVILVALMPERLARSLFKPVSLGAAKLPAIFGDVVSLVSTAVLLFIILVGYFGPHDPNANLLPLTIWALWWIGVLVLHGVFGNLWRYLNPWIGLHRLIMRESRPLFKLPERIGAWPAVALFLLFGSFAIVDPAPSDPTRLAHFVVGYWAFTFAGMVLFGAKKWLESCECFSVLFALISTIAPFSLAPGQKVGFPGWVILQGFTPSMALATLALVFLGSGSFDGLSETFWWLGKIGVNPLEFPGRSAIILESTAGFLGLNILLWGVFALCVYLGVRLGNLGSALDQEVSFRPAFILLALSTLPIGLGFHLAHFFTSFLISGQYALAATADFLSLGPWHVSVGFLSVPDIVRRIWLTQATIIVLSHVVAIVIAHAAARRLFPSRPLAAILSELPLTGFMIFYTVFGLWLLASPRGV